MSDETSVCLANIGPRERRKRAVFGAALLAVGVGLAVYGVGGNASRAWRWALFFPFWAGALGLFQAWGKTCVVLAAQGVRNMDGGQEAIDQSLNAQIRRQARGIHLKSLAAAALFTAIAGAL